jgi:hypothetical protein
MAPPNESARLVETVVLPVPPLPLAIEIIIDLIRFFRL